MNTRPQKNGVPVQLNRLKQDRGTRKLEYGRDLWHWRAI